MSECKRLRERVADVGDAAFDDDPTFSEHRATCAECRAFLLALQRVDATLAELPPITVPSELVARTLLAVQTDSTEDDSQLQTVAIPVASPSRLRKFVSRAQEVGERLRIARRRLPLPPISRRVWIGAIAAMLFLGIVVPNVLNSVQRRLQKRTMADMVSGTAYEVDNAYRAPVATGPGASESVMPQASGGARGFASPPRLPPATPPHTAPRYAAVTPPAPVIAPKEVYELKKSADESQLDDADGQGKDNVANNSLSQVAPDQQLAEQRSRNMAWQLDAASAYGQPASKTKAGNKADESAVDMKRQVNEKPAAVVALASATDKLLSPPERRPAPVVVGADAGFAGSARARPTARNIQFADGGLAQSTEGSERDLAAKRAEVAAEGDRRREVGQQLLTTLTWNDQLRYQDASGYWDNTYVPGDPWIRLLESRLRKNDIPFLAPDGSRYQLDAAARQYLQPFDQPREAALGVYLHSYRHAQTDSGPTRLLVQVGIQGTTRQSGLRPRMNVGVVLDLRGDVRTDDATSMRALLAALVEAKQVGDRFSVTVAGRAGGVAVAPEDFRHGPLTLATGKLFGADIDATLPTLGLVEAMSASLQTVASGDDPSSALGASVVLLVTPSRLADYIDELERLAHTASVSGIPTSVVGVGGQVDLDEIDRLALSGQGNRRLLGSPDEAEGLVDRELHAVSRVIARAVRLRIRLKPGVRLIDMLGSNRLDAGRAERVREAERSVDLRLARNLGIDADRGDDEEGMQVVIPSYYAGDSHVILLDVVTDHPGSIADVTVRYKDLVYLRNGIARATLSIDRRIAPPAPLELNVLKNLVALRLSDGIGNAGDLLAAGDIAAATEVLLRNRDLLDSLRGEVNGWSRDVELIHDANMLSEYLAVLTSQHATVPNERQVLADSMLVAGRMKVQARRH